MKPVITWFLAIVQPPWCTGYILAVTLKLKRFLTYIIATKIVPKNLTAILILLSNDTYKVIENVTVATAA